MGIQSIKFSTVHTHLVICAQLDVNDSQLIFDQSLGPPFVPNFLKNLSGFITDQAMRIFIPIYNIQLQLQSGLCPFSI